MYVINAPATNGTERRNMRRSKSSHAAIDGSRPNLPDRPETGQAGVKLPPPAPTATPELDTTPATGAPKPVQPAAGNNIQHGIGVIGGGANSGPDVPVG